MKLADRYEVDGFHPDVNLRAPAMVRAQLATAGLQELASVDFWDGEVRRFYVATDAGLYVGLFTPRHDMRFDPKLEANVTPWREVAGVHLAIKTELGEGSVLSVKIAEPPFERSAERDRDLQPLAEFGKVCLERHGKG